MIIFAIWGVFHIVGVFAYFVAIAVGNTDNLDIVAALCRFGLIFCVMASSMASTWWVLRNLPPIDHDLMDDIIQPTETQSLNR